MLSNTYKGYCIGVMDFLDTSPFYLIRQLISLHKNEKSQKCCGPRNGADQAEAEGIINCRAKKRQGGSKNNTGKSEGEFL